MSITMTHDFRLSFTQNAMNNCERFVSAGEPLRDDLLSQVKTVIRQNTVIISQYEDEITESKANLENTLRTTYASKVREWKGKRKSLYENELHPREKKIAFREAQNKRLQKCLDFHVRETARREKAKLERRVLEYPKRVKDLSGATSQADKALVKAVHALAKILGEQSLFQAIEALVALPQRIKRLENDRIVLENQGITCDAIPDKLHEAAEEMNALRQVVEKIVGRPCQVQRHTTTAKSLELSRAREQKLEREARKREGIR